MKNFFLEHSEYFDSVGQHHLSDLTMMEAFASIQDRMQKTAMPPSPNQVQQNQGILQQIKDSPWNPQNLTTSDVALGSAAGAGGLGVAATGASQLARVGMQNQILNTLAELNVPATKGLMNYLTKAGTDWPTKLGPYLQKYNAPAYQQFVEKDIAKTIMGLYKNIAKPKNLLKNVARGTWGAGKDVVNKGIKETGKQAIETLKNQGVRGTIDNLSQGRIVSKPSSYGAFADATEELTTKQIQSIVGKMSGQPVEKVKTLLDMGQFTPEQIAKAIPDKSDAVEKVLQPALEKFQGNAATRTTELLEQGAERLKGGTNGFKAGLKKGMNPAALGGAAAMGGLSGGWKGWHAGDQTQGQAISNATKTAVEEGLIGGTLGTGVAAGLGAFGIGTGGTATGLAGASTMAGMALPAAAVGAAAAGAGYLVGQDAKMGWDAYKANQQAQQTNAQTAKMQNAMAAVNEIKQQLSATMEQIKQKESDIVKLQDPNARSVAQQELRSLYQNYYNNVKQVQQLRHQGGLYSRQQWTKDQTDQFAQQHGLSTGVAQ